MQTSTDVTNPLANKYLYLGKELEIDNGLNWIKTDYRHYDPALGRFKTIDALTDLLNSITPYAYSYNSPIWFNDPTGLDPYVGDTLAEVTVTASRLPSKRTPRFVQFWLTQGNSQQKALAEKYMESGLPTLNGNRIVYNKNYVYKDTEFMIGLRKTYAGFSMYTGGLV